MVVICGVAWSPAGYAYCCDLPERGVVFMARLQVDNVIDKEGQPAVLLSNLRVHHPTLYWNIVVVMIASEMTCPLEFLHIPGGATGSGDPGDAGLRLNSVATTPRRALVQDHPTLRATALAEMGC